MVAKKIAPGSSYPLPAALLTDEELYLGVKPNEDIPEVPPDSPQLVGLIAMAQELRDVRFEITIAEYADRALEIGARRLDLRLEEQGMLPVHQAYLTEARQDEARSRAYQRGKNLFPEERAMRNYTSLGQFIDQAVGKRVVDPEIWKRAAQSARYPVHVVAQAVERHGYSAEESAMIALLLCKQTGFDRQRELTEPALGFGAKNLFYAASLDTTGRDFWVRRVNSLAYERGHIVKVSEALVDLAQRVYGSEAKRGLTLLGMTTFLRTRERPKSTNASDITGPILIAIHNQDFDQAESLLAELAQDHPEMIPERTWARLAANESELAFLRKAYELDAPSPLA